MIPLIHKLITTFPSDALEYPLTFDTLDIFYPETPGYNGEYTNEEGFVNVKLWTDAPTALDPTLQLYSYISSTIYDSAQISDKSVVEIKFNSLVFNNADDQIFKCSIGFPALLLAKGFVIEVERASQGAAVTYNLFTHDDPVTQTLVKVDVGNIGPGDVFGFQHSISTSELIFYKNGVEVGRSDLNLSDYETYFENVSAGVLIDNGFAADIDINFDIVQDPSLFSYSYPDQTVWDFYPKVFLWNDVTSLDIAASSSPLLFDSMFKDGKVYATMRESGLLSLVVKDAANNWLLENTDVRGEVGYTVTIRADDTVAGFGDDIIEINQSTNQLEHTFGGSAPAVGLKELSTTYVTNPITALGKSSLGETVVLRRDSTYNDWFVGKMENGVEVQKHTFTLLAGNTAATGTAEIYTVGSKMLIVPSVVLSQDNFSIVSSADNGETWAYATCSNSLDVDTSSSANYLDFRKMFVSSNGTIVIHLTNNGANFAMVSSDAVNWTVHPVPIISSQYDTIIGSAFVDDKVVFFREDFAELQWATITDLDTWFTVPLTNSPEVVGTADLSRETVADDNNIYAFERTTETVNGTIAIYSIPSTALVTGGTSQPWVTDGTVPADDTLNSLGDAFQLMDGQGNIIPGFHRNPAYIRVNGTWEVPEAYYLSYGVNGSFNYMTATSKMFGPGVTQPTKIVRCSTNSITFLEYSTTDIGKVNEVDPLFNTYFLNQSAVHRVFNNEDYYYGGATNTDVTENGNVNCVIGIKIDGTNAVTPIVINEEYTGGRFNFNDMVTLQNGSYYLVGGGIDRTTEGGVGTNGQVLFYDSGLDTYSFFDIPNSASFYAAIEFNGHVYTGGKPETTNDQNLIWRTVSGDNNWQLVNSQGTGPFDDVFKFATDGTTLWAITGFGIISTTDGTTWVTEVHEDDTHISFNFGKGQIVLDSVENKLYAIGPDEGDSKVYIIDRDL